jgi:hypothetical protein
MKQAMKSMLDRRPRLKALANAALRNHQLIALNYSVSMTPRYSGAAHPALHGMVAESGDSYRALLNSFLVYKERPAATTGVQWVNGYLPALDSIAIYCLLAETNPKRYVEIGSGNSTLFARASIRDNKLRTRITSIDPTPRRNIEDVSDEILRRPVETVPLEYFEEIEPGDILFVDNSHRCFTNSDVTVFFVDILPLLNPGTLVHLHDIWLPWDYPADVGQQASSEQYLLTTAMLMGKQNQACAAQQACRADAGTDIDSGSHTQFARKRRARRLFFLVQNGTAVGAGSAS